MKKISAFIIIFVALFSSLSSVNAQEGYLSQILELQTGPEVYTFENISSLPNKSFSSSAVQFTYDEVKKVDTILRAEIIRQYRSGEISYYEMNDIITNYKNFIYYTEKTFGYIADNEKGTRGKEIEDAIYSGYTKMRASYNNIIYIIQ